LPFADTKAGLMRKQSPHEVMHNSILNGHGQTKPTHSKKSMHCQQALCSH
jgi:hypothetical protein